MPVVSGTLTASGSATVTWTGELILVTSLLLYQVPAAVAWVRFLDSSDLTADGSATVSFTGETVRTLISIGAFTYTPIPPPTPLAGDHAAFIAAIRKEPAPSINNSLGSELATCTFRVTGITKPDPGLDVQFDLEDGFGLMFAGTIQRVTQVFEGQTDQVSWDIFAVGYGWAINGRWPVACYEGSATDVIESLVADFAPDFTADVVGGLPTIKVVFDGTQPFIACLQKIVSLLGSAYFRITSEKVVKFFLEDLTDPPDELNNTTNTTLLFDPGITSEEDISQIRNRTTAIGAGTRLVEDAHPGDTVLVVDDIELFGGAGLAASGCQRLGYGGARVTSTIPQRETGGNALIAEAVNHYTPFLGSIFDDGPICVDCFYRVSFVSAGGVESNLGTPAGVLFPYVGGVSSSGLMQTTGGNLTLSGSYEWGISYVTASGQTTGVTSLGATTMSGSNNAMSVPCPVHPDKRIVSRRIWRTKSSGGETGPGGVKRFYNVGTVNDNTTPSFLDTMADVAATQLAPWNDCTSLQTEPYYNTIGFLVNLRNIPIGPDGTTARKIYRGFHGSLGSLPRTDEYTLLTTISDNSTRTFSDSQATATRPEVDYCGAGADGTAAPGDLPPIVKKTIFGVSGITELIPAGSTISLMAVADDPAAQATLAALMGGDGVREYTVTDTNMRTPAECQARADAENTLFKDPIVTVNYTTLDTKSVPGKLVVSNLTDPPLVGEFKIQTVNIKDIHDAEEDESDLIAPRYQVTASSMKFTLIDLLRRVKLES